MSRARRWLWISGAWLVPVTWVTVALLSGPSDGSVVSPPVTTPTAHAWSKSATVVETYGATPLRPGDVIRTIDGRPFGEWVTAAERPARTLGEVVRYEVVRPGGSLDLDVELAVELSRYPVAEALPAHLPVVGFLTFLLATGSAVFWQRPGETAARSFLAAGALLPAGLTSYPLGLGAIDLAGSRGLWPHLVGEVACAAGLGLLGVAAASVAPAGGARRFPASRLAVVAAPAGGYAGWILLAQQRRDHEAARLQAAVTVVGPALVAVTLVTVAVLALQLVRAGRREDRLSVRLVLLAVLGALAARGLLGDLPRELLGRPLVPWELLTLVLGPALSGCLAVAVLRYRIDEVEPVVRRALLHAAVAAVVGATFLVVAGTVDRASDASLAAVVTGGVVALLVLPLAVLLQRTARRLVYGDREFPRRVVSDLRRLDPLAHPTVALRETLELLARRLRLSYASIQVFATPSSTAIETAVGDSRGRPTTVDLVVGGASLGRLELEVAPDRDPFGPGDRRLLEDVGTQVGALVQATTMGRELQLSRQRLVAAREEERRRVRRDLHDGLGPSLAALSMRLEAARDLVGSDPEAAADLIERLSEQVRSQVDEVRRLVDGLRPPALDQLGLVSSLRQLADEHEATVGKATGPVMSWSVEAIGELDPLPAAVEVAAYRIVLEAVNNALRHSGASTCRVRLWRDPDVLHVEIRDTGAGLAPARTAGVGLSSMRERAAELGGTCTTTSTAGVGTVVEARLPLGTGHEEPRW